MEGLGVSACSSKGPHDFIRPWLKGGDCQRLFEYRPLSRSGEQLNQLLLSCRFDCEYVYQNALLIVYMLGAGHCWKSVL